jgi:hypothetical protein
LAPLRRGSLLEPDFQRRCVLARALQTWSPTHKNFTNQSRCDMKMRRPKNRRRYSLEQLLAGLSKQEEIDWGPPRGKEVGSSYDEPSSGSERSGN